MVFTQYQVMFGGKCYTRPGRTWWAESRTWGWWWETPLHTSAVTTPQNWSLPPKRAGRSGGGKRLFIQKTRPQRFFPPVFFLRCEAAKEKCRVHEMRRCSRLWHHPGSPTSARCTALPPAQTTQHKKWNQISVILWLLKLWQKLQTHTSTGKASVREPFSSSEENL